MKITEVETFLVNYGSRNWIFVKVSTDSGLHGVGEAFNTLKDRATEQAVHYLAHWLIGQDPLRVEHLWQKMYRFSRFPLGTIEMSALSSLEHALWDIIGKHFGTPVYNLLGGLAEIRSDSIPTLVERRLKNSPRVPDRSLKKAIQPSS